MSFGLWKVAVKTLCKCQLYQIIHSASHCDYVQSLRLCTTFSDVKLWPAHSMWSIYKSGKFLTVSSLVVAILTYCKDRKEDRLLWFTVWINLTNMENHIQATETCLSQHCKMFVYRNTQLNAQIILKDKSIVIFLWTGWFTESLDHYINW